MGRKREYTKSDEWERNRKLVSNKTGPSGYLFADIKVSFLSVPDDTSPKYGYTGIYRSAVFKI